MSSFSIVFYGNINLSSFSQKRFYHNQNRNLSYLIPFDREFHGLQNGIENIKKDLASEGENRIVHQISVSNRIL